VSTGKQFRWRFSSWKRLSIRCRFPSQLGLCISCKSNLVDYFWVVSYSVFGDDYRVNRDWRADKTKRQLGKLLWWWFSSRQWLSFRWQLPSQLGLCVLTNQGVSCGGSLSDDFWVVNYSVFYDDYRVNRDCASIWNQASAGEADSVTIFKSAAIQFLGSIFESTGIVCADQSRHQM